MWRKTTIIIFLALIIMTVSAQAFTKHDWITGIVRNTPYCKDNCELTLTFCNPTPDDILVTGSMIKHKVNNLNNIIEEPSWYWHNWSESTPVYGLVEHSYQCNYSFNYTIVPKHAWCYNNSNGTTVVFEHDFTRGNITAKKVWWNETETTGYSTTQHSERVGETSKLKDLQFFKDNAYFDPIGKVWPASKCYNISIKGSLKQFNDAIDIVPSGWGGFEYPEYAVWNSTLYNMTAVVNYTNLWKGSLTSGEALVYAALYNCSGGMNLTSFYLGVAMNVTCYDNLVQRLLNGTDGSDVEFYKCDSKDILNFTRLNFTGLSNWSLYSNLTNNVSQDAWRVMGINQNSNTSNVCVSLNGTLNGATNADTNTGMLAWLEDEPSLIYNYAGLTSLQGISTFVNANSVYVRTLSCAHGSNYSDNGCYYHDGTGDKIYGAGYLNFTDDLDWSQTSWTKHSNNIAFITGCMDTTNKGIGVIRHSGAICAGAANYWHVWSGEWHCSTVAATQDVWHHIALVNDNQGVNANITLYIDGVNILNYTDTYTDCTGNFMLGGAYNTNDDDGVALIGFSDSWKQFNYSMTSSQVLDDYLMGAHFPGEFYSLTANIADTSGPTITFVNQSPSDLTTTNAISLGLNVSYNITDATGVNASSVQFIYNYLNISSGNICKFVNASSSCGEYILSSGGISNVSNIYTFRLSDNDAYPATYNLDEKYVESTLHATNPSITNANKLIKVRLQNVSAYRNYGMFEFMANTSGSGSLTVYYCNSTYASGVPSSSTDCSNVYTFTGNTTFRHEHGPYSFHQVFPLIIVGGKVGSVGVTSTSYVVFRTVAGSTWNFYGVSNDSQSISTSNNNGNAWSAYSGTLDSHLHQYALNDTLSYKVRACDTLGNCANSSVRNDSYDITRLNPSPPSILLPNESSYDVGENISVNWTCGSGFGENVSVNASNVTVFFSNFTQFEYIGSFECNNTNTSIVFNASESGSYFVRVWNCDNHTAPLCSFADSANFTIPSCTISIVGFCDGCRYSSTNVTGLNFSCSGMLTNCSFVVNSFLPEGIANCSSFSVTLEPGWNRMNVSGYLGSTYKSYAFDVWAKTDGWVDMLPMFVVGIGGCIAFFVGAVSGFVGFFVLAGFLVLLLAWEFVAFSMPVAALCLFAGLGLMMRGVLR